MSLKQRTTALMGSRFHGYIARVQQSQAEGDLVSFQKYLAQLLVNFNTFRLEGDEQTLPEEQLCSVCDKYDWIIPLDVDLERFQVKKRNKTTKPVWLASQLPSGSMFNLLTRPRCPVCILVLHLMTPLPVASLVAWAANQPLPILYGFQYTMHYVRPEQIHVKIKLPASNIWEEAGMIEAKPESIVQEQALMTSSLARATNVHYRTLKYWFWHCNTNHRYCYETRMRRPKDLPIRLIDVKDHCIVSGTPQDQYFALSYVWGGVKSLQATEENIGELEQKGALLKRAAEIPTSILDAMAFVAKLDERYLWVDALCIVQNNVKEKHAQISRMHEIYAAAYATIVQHAGSDANAGLPGVREGSRSLIAMRSQLGAYNLLAQASYATPKVLNTSIHSKRGWTMQEVLLSNRCLHFSNKHITFVCGDEWAQDWNFQDRSQGTLGSIRSGLMQPISKSMGNMNPFSLLRAYDDKKGKYNDEERSSETTRWLRYFDIYGRILTSYTSRALSFESDTLNAFQGLCGAITRLNGARFHFGVPSTCFDLALLWINLGPGIRRASYSCPSWSWAAWQGQSAYNICNLLGDSSHTYYINSYVQHFYIKEDQDSLEITRTPFSHEDSDEEHAPTPYFVARTLTRDPVPDTRLTQDLPLGCLHFWAEECPMDQLSVYMYHKIPYLKVTSSQKCCGVLDASVKASSDGRPPLFEDAQYSLILMSESDKLLPLWKFDSDGDLEKVGLGSSDVFMGDFGYNEFYTNGKDTRTAWIFNVLLIKRKGRFCERVAFGQVHMLAWLEMKRRRRYIRLV